MGRDRPTYHIKNYPLERGSLEIQYIEEFFGEFDRKKTAAEIRRRLEGRAHSILMAEARLPDDPSLLVPVAFKVSHEIFVEESEAKLRDLVNRLRGAVDFSGRRILYSWIGGTRSDWRGQGHFRALTEEQEAWALENGFKEIVVKTKNRFYGMRATLTNLGFDVVQFERNALDPGESKVYVSKRIGPEVIERHQSRRSVTQAV
jgi:GNAT superfamily N-acetyltransferase